MNTKTIIAAAAVIILVGIGTGVAIGGKTTTKTLTTTVASTVTTTVTDPGATVTDESTNGDDETTSTPSGEAQTPDDPIPADTELFTTVSQPDGDENVSIEYDEAAQLRLGAPAPGFNILLSPSYRNETSVPGIYKFEINNPDTDSARAFVTTMGFDKDTATGVSAKVYFRLDGFDTPIVRQFTIYSGGPAAGKLKSVSIPVQGTSNLSVEIRSDDRKWSVDTMTVTMLQPGFDAVAG